MAQLRNQLRALEHENLTLRHGRSAQTTRLTAAERRASKERSAARARLQNPRYGWRARLRAIVRARELGVISDAFDEAACLRTAKDSDGLPPLPDVILRETGSVPPPGADPWLASAWLARRLARLCVTSSPTEIECLDALAVSLRDLTADPQLRQAAAHAGLCYQSGTWAMTPQGVWAYPGGMPLWSDRGDLRYPDGTCAHWKEAGIFNFPHGMPAAQGQILFTADQRPLTVAQLEHELRDATELWPRYERGLAELEGNELAKGLALVELAWLYLRPWTSTPAREAESDATAVFQ